MHRWIRTLGIIASGGVLWVTLAYGQGFGTSFIGRLANLPSGTVIATPTLSSLTPIQSIGGTGSVTACAGHSILVTAAGTATLPAGTSLGQRCTVVSTTAAIISIDVASGSDTMILNGTALTAGFKATSDGTDEATLYCENNATNVWRCRTIQGVFADGGA